MAQNYGECPICCDTFTSPTELEFFPCSCNFQPCRFCVSQMKACPLCKKEYNPETFRIIPNMFYHMGPVQRMKQRIISRNNLIIRRIPLVFCDYKTLSKQEFLGQYGPWVSLIITNGVVYIQYQTQEQADVCALALNMSFFDGAQIRVTYGYQKFCPNFINNKPCHNTQCQFVHEATSIFEIYHIEEQQTELEEAIKVQNIRGREIFISDRNQRLMFPPSLATQQAVTRMLNWKKNGEVARVLTDAAINNVKK